MKNVMRGPTNNQRDTARIEAFSDGVFAIAITLLVLNIRLPEGNRDTNLWLDLRAQWPMFLAYIMSFVVIGIIWANHHHMFTYINHTDRVSLVLNTLGLMFVAFMPYPTALLAQYIQTPNAQIAVSIYSAVSLMVTVIYNILWWYATTNYRLVRKDTDPRVHHTILISYLLGIPLYLLTFILAFINAWASLAVYGLIALLYISFAGNFPTMKRLHVTATPARQSEHQEETSEYAAGQHE